MANLSLTPALAAVVKGSRTRLTPRMVDSAGNEIRGLMPTWKSSASEIATVSADGLVTGVGYGQVSITASIGSGSAIATLVVSAEPTLKSYALASPWLAHGSSNPFRSRAYVMTSSSLVALGDGGANGINSSNIVVGMLSVGPFIWRGSGVSLLTGAATDAAWTITGAGEINNRGQILATADNSDGRKAHTVLLTPVQP